MNRTDRLVAMVMHLQGRRVVRAEELAEHFEISVRTVYRDIAALSEAGVAVAGEAGVGYSLVKGYHLPPVMFTTEEALALFVGGEMVNHFTDASVAAPMRSALAKIRSVLPADRQDDVDRLAAGMAVEGNWRMPSSIDQRVLLPIQRAIVSRRVLRMTYHVRARDNEETTRDVEPLGVAFYGGAWYLVAWCRLRRDFRHFKLERVRALELLEDRFKPRPGFRLRDHLVETNARMETLPATVWFSEAVVERARRESYGGLGVERPVRGGIEAEMRTFSYTWLARWIVSLGGEAEAIAPASLRAAVGEQARCVLSRHS